MPTSLVQRIVAPIRRAFGLPGMTYLPVTGGMIPSDSPWNWWQAGVSPSAFPKSAIVEACISAYARTVAMCPGAHWRESEGGGRERVTNSALSRVLQRPNSYQTISDFMLNAIRDLYADGNAYALALRNNRYEIDELHLMRAQLCRPTVAETLGRVWHTRLLDEIFYDRIPGHTSKPAA